MNIYESIKENLLEAEEDEFEETEVEMEVPEEGTEPEEMTDEETDIEKQEDAEDIVEDEVEEPFYATDERFDELREILEPLEFRLLLINDKYLVVGRLNGAEVEILKQNEPGETEEPTFGFVEAPDKLEELIKFGTLYEDPDLVEEGEEALEPNHEAIVKFLSEMLPKEEKEDTEEKEEAEEAEEANEVEVEPEEETEEEE